MESWALQATRSRSDPENLGLNMLAGSAAAAVGSLVLNPGGRADDSVSSCSFRT